MKIIIMGATSGLGLALARRLARAGHTVGAAGRNAQALDRLRREFPATVHTAVIDITRPEACAQLHDLISLNGGMDCYLHTAGIGCDSVMPDPARETAVARVNVTGFTRMVDCAWGYFTDRCNGRGRIAAITSVAGTKGIDTMAAYSASKSYQRAYLEALDQLSHLQGLNIKIIDLRPGWVKTPLLPQGERYRMLMGEDYATGRLLKALARKWKRGGTATVDWRWRLLTGLWQLCPRWLWVRLPVRPGSLG